MNRNLLKVTFLSLCLFPGCGGGDGLERAPITGLVTVQGAPLAGASVQFMPASGTPGEGALGTSDAEGKFTVISSRQSDEGIPAGEYTVRVSRLVNVDGTPLPSDAADADYPDAWESVPTPYSGMDSPLKAVIAPEGGEVKVEIPVALLQKKK